MASSMIERCVQAALGAMQEAERRSGSVAARHQLADALAALNRCHTSLRAEFPSRVDQAFMQGLDSARANADLPPPPVDSEQVLALIEDAEVSRFVEASRLQQTAMPVVEHSLTRLDSLISSALGLPVVRADLNPLRPDLLCNALLQLVDEQSEAPELRAQWVRHMSKQFAQELDGMYASIADMLEAQGVEEARYRLKLTEGGHLPAAAAGAAAGAGGGGGGAGGKGSNAGGNAPMPPDADALRQWRELMPGVAQLARAFSAVPQELIRDFLYQPQWLSERDDVLPAGFHEQVRAQMTEVASLPSISYDERAEARELARLRALSVVERPARQLAVESPLPPQQWGEQSSPQARTQALMDLKAKAQKLSQVLGLDAVRTLVNQVAGDARVLAPVREAFVALEPALLRMAMADPRYFGDDGHPARRLIEEVAQRSFKYNDEFSSDFERFMEPVRQAVRELDASAQPDKQDFAARLQGLQERWKAEDASEKPASDKGMVSMRFAQERQTLADRIAWEFSLRSDLDQVPGLVADFLFQDWSLVIAHAQMTAERSQLDPGGYLAVVSDLLWSVKPEAALRQPARLFEVVPGIVSTLRRGLHMLGKKPEESQTFFGALMNYHDPVLRLRRLRSALDAEASGLAPLPTESQLVALGFPPPPTERPKPRAAEQPWLGHAEMEAAGFHDIDSNPAPLDAAPPGSQQAAESEFADTDILPRKDDAHPAKPAPPAAASKSAAASHWMTESEEDAQARTRATMARLRTGDWVDLYVRDQWLRAKLTWGSDNGSLFLFTSHGGRLHSMTRRTCEKLIRVRHLRLVDAGAVVDKALRSLTGKAQTAAKKTRPRRAAKAG